MKGQKAANIKNRGSKEIIERFTISMSKDLLDELLKITGERKKSKAINIVCREFVRIKRKENLLSLRGIVPLESKNHD